MSFRIYVTDPALEVPDELYEHASPEERDALFERAKASWIYEAPLGADGAVGMWWSAIARELNLPLLAGIYNNGLRVSQPDELSRLDAELDQLETAWGLNELYQPEWSRWTDEKTKEHLRERMGFFREALKVARERGAILDVV